MNRPLLDVADLVRAAGDAFIRALYSGGVDRHEQSAIERSTRRIDWLQLAPIRLAGYG